MTSRNQASRVLRYFIIYFLLIVVFAIVVIPLLWAVASSFSQNDLIFKNVFPFSWKAFFPQQLTLDAYKTLFTQKGFGLALLNTSILSLATVLVSGIINLIAGFAFATFNFKGKNLLFALVMFSFMVPIEVTIIPQYIQMKNLGWLNTWQGLLIPGFANSMVIFLFRQFFADFPKDLIEAARVDGASWLKILISIIVPLSKPVLIGAAIMLFTSSWNSFFWPLVVAPDPKFRVIQVAISLTVQQTKILWNQMFAGSLLAAIFPILIVLPLQKYYVQSITSTGIKE